MSFRCFPSSPKANASMTDEYRFMKATSLLNTSKSGGASVGKCPLTRSMTVCNARLVSSVQTVPAVTSGQRLSADMTSLYP